MSIFYVHGFASCADANINKKKELESMFPTESVYLLNYDSSLCYEKIFECLINQVKHINTDEEFFIGTSLGAFFASKLSSYFYSMSTVLFNPLIYPFDYFKEMRGTLIKSYYTGTSFTLTDSVINSYKELSLDYSSDLAYSIFLSKNDSVINNKNSLEFFNKDDVYFIDSDHRINSFLSFKDYLIKARYKIAFQPVFE